MLRSELASPPLSRRFRALVHLSALLLIFMSVAQAAHNHGLWIDGSRAHVSSGHVLKTVESESSDLNCPLCIVSHSALPSFPAFLGRLNRCAEILSIAAYATAPRRFWAYDLFGRPPPNA